jgi:hypothetical protein
VIVAAVFESWHISDGKSPPLRVGDLVNLSFELQPTSLDRLDDGIPFLDISTPATIASLQEYCVYRATVRTRSLIRPYLAFRQKLYAVQ